MFASKYATSLRFRVLVRVIIILVTATICYLLIGGSHTGDRESWPLSSSVKDYLFYVLFAAIAMGASLLADLLFQMPRLMLVILGFYTVGWIVTFLLRLSDMTHRYGGITGIGQARNHEKGYLAASLVITFLCIGGICFFWNEHRAKLRAATSPEDPEANP